MNAVEILDSCDLDTSFCIQLFKRKYYISNNIDGPCNYLINTPQSLNECLQRMINEGETGTVVYSAELPQRDLSNTLIYAGRYVDIDFNEIMMEAETDRIFTVGIVDFDLDEVLTSNGDKWLMIEQDLRIYE